MRERWTEVGEMLSLGSGGAKQPPKASFVSYVTPEVGDFLLCLGRSWCCCAEPV